MLIILLINIVIIIWIYLRYYHFPEDIINTKEEVKDIDPIVMGFINDREFSNNYDLILSEIINLNIKKHIIIEYDKKDISKYNYTIKQNLYMEKENIEKYELILLDFLFSQKSEISRSEFEQKIKDSFNTYNIQYNQLQKVLEEKLIKENIIDIEKKKELEKITKTHKNISVTVLSILIILKIFVNININLASLLIFVFEILISRLLILKASNYTYKGEIIRNNIFRYKNEIRNKEFLINKKEMNNILLEKEFADSIALHINTDAKESFINNIFKNTKNSVKKTFLKLFIITIIIILIAIILKKLTILLDRDGIVLLYSILAIIIASSADIVYALGKYKKTK